MRPPPRVSRRKSCDPRSPIARDRATRPSRSSNEDTAFTLNFAGNVLEALANYVALAHRSAVTLVDAPSRLMTLGSKMLGFTLISLGWLQQICLSAAACRKILTIFPFVIRIKWD